MLEIVKRPFSAVGQFVNGIISELKQVDYLSRHKTLRHTFFIIASLVVATLILVLFDKILLEIRNLILQF